MRALTHHLWLFFILAFVCLPSFATSADGLTDAEVRAFLHKLQTTVASGDAAAVAPLISFPLRVNWPHHKHANVSERRFAAQFSSIFTPAVVSTLMRQRSETLFRSYRGAMVGDGEVWFSGICPDSKCHSHKVFVISINVLH